MKPGSLVAYVGGQTAYDLESGCGLDPDAIYEIKEIGTHFINGKFCECIELYEMPMVRHMIFKFLELQPPGTINIEALLGQARSD
jgi:hypothetical protein